MKMTYVAWLWGLCLAGALAAGNWPAAFACAMLVFYESGVFKSAGNE